MQIEDCRRQLDEVHLNNDEEFEKNSELNMEVQELLRHSEVLSGQNKELQFELENFILTDEVVK